jgi:hypothetical protein
MAQLKYGRICSYETAAVFRRSEPALQLADASSLSSFDVAKSCGLPQHRLN